MDGTGNGESVIGKECVIGRKIEMESENNGEKKSWEFYDFCPSIYASSKGQNRPIEAVKYDPFDCDTPGKEKVAKGFFKALQGKFEYIYTPDKWLYDIAGVYNGSKPLVIEAKDRWKYNSDSFERDGVMIEQDKYWKLVTYGRMFHTEIYYASTFKDGVMLVWNLTRLPFNRMKEINPRRSTYTVKASGYKKKPAFGLMIEDVALKARV